MEQHQTIAVAIVANNCDEQFLERNFRSLSNQTRKLDHIARIDQFSPSDFDYTLFLNGDTFLSPDFVEKGVHFMKAHDRAAAISGVLLGYDTAKETPNGLYESTGIFCTPYGKWFDRDQGQPLNAHLYLHPEEVLALNGSSVFCRTKALAGIKKISWDEVDLCLTLRKKGWKLFFVPSLIAYHCRELPEPALSK